MTRMFAAAVLLFFTGPTLLGQSFDVASIKPAGLNTRVGSDFRVFPGRIHITNLNMRLIVQMAYGVKAYQLSGGPAWLGSDEFDIEAKADGEPGREQLLQMLQNLLAERCGLKVRRESREDSVYALIVGKNGPKLKPSAATESYFHLYRNTPPELPGVNYTIGAQKVTMARFAEGLGDHMRRTVLDRTGISGEFDIKLNYAIAEDPEAPPITTAIQEQLGLKLETVKAPVEILVIDQIVKPTGN